MLEMKEQKYKMIDNFITMDNEARKSVERRLITRNIYVYYLEMFYYYTCLPKPKFSEG